MPKRKRRTKGSGTCKQLPSGRWQAKTRNPTTGDYVPAPHTFDTRLDADAWLARQEKDKDLGIWEPPRTDDGPASKSMPFREYAAEWMNLRELKPKTRRDYEGNLDRHILPVLGDVPLDRIDSQRVRKWHSQCAPGKPTAKAHCYSLLKTILATAVDDDLIDRNPCRIKGAQKTKRKSETKIATPGEVQQIFDAMPPDLAVSVLLGSWTALRLGEVLALQRQDIDLAARKLIVNKTAVQLAGGPPQLGDPKTDAGTRTITIPANIVEPLQEHLDSHTADEPTAYLFPARNRGTVPMSKSTFYDPHYYKARAAAGRPDLAFHDLRHTGATWNAQQGATLADNMARLGHSDTATAMKYQHAAEERDEQLADNLAAFAEDSENVVPLKNGERKKPRHAG